MIDDLSDNMTVDMTYEVLLFTTRWRAPLQLYCDITKCEFRDKFRIYRANLEPESALFIYSFMKYLEIDKFHIYLTIILKSCTQIFMNEYESY